MNNRETHATGIERCDFSRYELMSLTPATGFVAVYAQDDADGSASLYEMPVDAIGLARVTTHFHQRANGWKGSLQYKEPETEVEPVCLILAEGSWEICNQSSNFAGLARAGDDITQAISHLDGDYLARLRPTAQNETGPTSGIVEPVESSITLTTNGNNEHGKAI